MSWQHKKKIKGLKNLDDNSVQNGQFKMAAIYNNKKK